jgi:hypothetical protein
MNIKEHIYKIKNSTKPFYNLICSAYKNSDKENIKRLIQDQVKQYINSIAPGNSLYLGQINNIGLDTENVEYFNVVQIFANDEEITDFEILQTITAKFLFDQIIFWEVEN